MKKVSSHTLEAGFWYLRGEKHFKPRPQNSILVPLRGSFQNFRQAPLSFFMGVVPGGESIWFIGGFVSHAG